MVRNIKVNDAQLVLLADDPEGAFVTALAAQGVTALSSVAMNGPPGAPCDAHHA